MMITRLTRDERSVIVTLITRCGCSKDLVLSHQPAFSIVVPFFHDDESMGHRSFERRVLWGREVWMEVDPPKDKPKRRRK